MTDAASTRHASKMACTARLVVSLAALLALLLGGVACASAEETPTSDPLPGPLSAEASLAALQLGDGLVAEVVAAEPLVVDPVAIDWGADGKLWVAEMADYPLGMDGQGQPGGRIRFLEDTDGDGKYDRSTVFLDRVAFPNGVMAYGRGVLVTAAPELFYAEDTDGDGRADHKEVLYSGFVAANQQLRVNGLRYGLDNWIHCASGAHTPEFGKDRGIRSVKLDQTIPLGSRDFRIRPATGELDPQSGPSQFGRARDDWGNWFGVQNAHPLWHFALDDWYVRRNSFFAPPDARVQVIEGEAPRIYSAKKPQKRFHSFHLSNRFTSACGIAIYRDELLFPREREQHGFSCAPFHNLVHHAVLSPRGITFVGRRAETEQASEWFASRDRWCRPVMTRTGPDGTLWVVDMYRYMIEHPQFLSDAGRAELAPHYRAGDDRGRIYRVYRRGKSPRTWPRVSEMSTAQLVETLSHPNGVLRDLAQRQLIERPDDASVPLLEAAAGESNALGRLHAMCTLDGIAQLKSELLRAALSDKEPVIRRHAVRLAEPKLVADEGLRDAFLGLAAAGDPDAKVRQQIAYSLGAMQETRATELLVERLMAEPVDEHMTAAYMSSLKPTNIEHAIDHLRSVQRKTQPPRFDELERTLLEMSIAMGVHRPAGLALSRLTMAKPGDWTNADLRRFAAIFDATGETQRTDWPVVSPGAAIVLPALTAQLTDVIIDEKADIDRRAAAVGLLFRFKMSRETDLATVRTVLAPQTPIEIQLAVIKRMATRKDARVTTIVFAGWQEYGPAARAEILGYVASRPTWVAALLDGVAKGEVSVSDIGVSLAQKLRWHSDQKLRARVRGLLEAVDEDRQAVVEQYEAALQLAGDVQRGQLVFKEKCATCHRDGEMGHEVGPRLSAITDQTPRGLLVSILDPNRAVEAKYVNYAAITLDGRSATGVLATETSTSVTLREADAKETVVLRRDLDELQSTGKSLMPEGLEKQLSPQDVADVIAFVTRPRVTKQPGASTGPRERE